MQLKSWRDLLKGLIPSKNYWLEVTLKEGILLLFNYTLLLDLGSLFCNFIYFNPFFITTIAVKYLRDLGTEGIHLSSSKKIITDDPLDNQGKGEAFSPTDIVANGLASCILAVLAFKARNLFIDLKGTTAKVKKVMNSNPIRIIEIKVEVYFSNAVESKTKLILERAALKCPFTMSLHPDLKQSVSFHWPV